MPKLSNRLHQIKHFSSTRSNPKSKKQCIPESSDLEWLFASLFELHGPRNWWPTVHGGKFELVVGAILVQNTAWKNTERALVNMREADIWSFTAILDIPITELQNAIRPSGYYKTKARKLREFATFITDNYNGDLNLLFALDISKMREQLLSVWGIGEETADDIILYGAEKPSFVIDAYTKRLLNRLGWKAEDKSYSAYQHLFHTRFPQDTYLYNEFHALIDYHSARICKSKPICNQCGLSKQCPVGLGITPP